MRQDRLMRVLAIPLWAAMLSGCAAPAAPGTIPACREQTGILMLAYQTVRDGWMMGRTIVIDGGTYAAREGSGPDKPEGSATAGPVPQKLMNQVWSAADEIVRSGPFVRDSETEYRWQLGNKGTASAPALKSDRGILGLMPANIIDICVEGRQPGGEHYVVWPLGKEPADPKVRKLLDLIHDVDRWDSRAKFSPFPK